MKKKVLLLSDDIRVPSGVGTMSKSFVMGTVKHFDWVQLGAAVNHPDHGKMFDLSKATQKETGVKDASVKIYANNGYGDVQRLRQILQVEKPDAILHFTDPRFWGWLYSMEHEIRQHIPIMYYNIWDDLPFPHWNENAYSSCDLLMAISKQTYNVNKHVCQQFPRADWSLTYVPHGINEDTYKPVDKNSEKFKKFRSTILNGGDYDFVGLFASRNITRKHPADLISAFQTFVKSIPQDKADKVCLILHTDAVDNAGTDLLAVSRMIAPDVTTIFSTGKFKPEEFNMLYNMADVQFNPSSAEGFGLTHMEAMMAGTPTVATVTGGLQDQMGFKVNGEEFAKEHLTEENPSNSNGKLSREHGEWVYPLWPDMSLQGSPATPYIYDSRAKIEDIVSGIKYWYGKTPEERAAAGLAGREWAIENGFTADNMHKTMTDSINGCFENFKPSPKYQMFKGTPDKIKYPIGALV